MKSYYVILGLLLSIHCAQASEEYCVDWTQTGFFVRLMPRMASDLTEDLIAKAEVGHFIKNLCECRDVGTAWAHPLMNLVFVKLKEPLPSQSSLWKDILSIEGVHAILPAGNVKMSEELYTARKERLQHQEHQTLMEALKRKQTEDIKYIAGGCGIS